MFGVQWDLILKYLETKGVSEYDLTVDSSYWGNYRDGVYNISTDKKNMLDPWSGDFDWSTGKVNKSYGGADVGAAYLLETGASDTFAKQNIYDFAGNIMEWVLENSNIEEEPIVERGGYFNEIGKNEPAAYRYRNPEGTANLGLGFRVSLYKDEGIGPEGEPASQEPTYIPEEYTHVQGTTLEKCYVIKDTLGNEFVWIEVPQTTDVYKTAGLGIVQFSESNLVKIENDLKSYVSTYRNGTTNKDEYNSQVETGLTEAEYNSEKRKMLRSIYANGGFYIGRYETGIAEGERTAEGEATQQPVIIKSANPYNYVTTTQAQTLSQTFATTGYTSSLMYGIQWDLVIKYLATKQGTTPENLNENSTAWGRYLKTKYSTTGYSSTYKKQNIYDLAGNISERTLESSSTYVVRGGSYKDSGSGRPASYRANDDGTSQANVGFRVALYKDSGTEGVVADVVDPHWTINAIDKTNEKVTLDLTVTDKYFANSTLTTENISIYVDNVDVTSEDIQMQISEPTPVMEGETQIGVKYTLTIDMTQHLKQTGKPYKEWSGTTKIVIAEGIATDKYGNTSKQQELELGHTDVIKPEFTYKYSTADIDYDLKTARMVFSVADKFYKERTLTINDLTILIDGQEPVWKSAEEAESVGVIKTLTTTKILVLNKETNIVEEKEIDYVLQETEQKVGETYELLLTELEQEKIAGGKNYLDYSGIITLTIPKGIVKDTSDNTNNAQTITMGLDFNDETQPETPEEIPEEESYPYIPDNFTQVDGTDLSTGLVVKDASGNEYVWVEVPKDTTVYRETTLALDLDNLSGNELINAYNAIEKDLHTYTSLFRNGTTYTDTWSSAEATGLTESTYYIQKNKMLKSIFKNGGFYVGRYETGIASSYRTEGGNATETPVIKANAYPYNFVTPSQAQTLASKFATDEYTSSLMFGVQWDLVLKYLQTKGATEYDLTVNSASWGNYEDSEYKVTSKKYSEDPSDAWGTGTIDKTYLGEEVGYAYMLGTGASTLFAKQNIYDLAGNVWEITLEYTKDSENPCAMRAGSYKGIGSEDYASHRHYPENASYYGDVGFRVSLYRDEDYTVEEIPTEPTYIPDGYTHVTGTTMQNGYVVQDTKGNQYVWVEVPQTAEVYKTTGLGITHFTDNIFSKIEKDLQTYTSLYRNGTEYTDTWFSEEATGLTENDYNTQKKKMLKSIYKNGGFYVGRYETGMDYSEQPRFQAGNATQTPVIKQHKYPYNWVSSAQAQTLSRGFAGDGYTSSLMFGVQWDLILKYLETKGATQYELTVDSTMWGNYANSSYNLTSTSKRWTVDGEVWVNTAINSVDEDALLSTGASTAFAKQNIYDLAGNTGEWTLEYSQNTEAPVRNRGGSYDLNGEYNVARREFEDIEWSAFGSVSFRVSLYKDEGTGPIDVTYPEEPTYIPEGHTHVEGTTMKDGYVIQNEETGNQFVWIEVPQTAEVYKTAGLEITEFTIEEFDSIEKDLQTYTSAYRNETLNLDEYKSDVTTGLSQNNYNIQKKKMLKSIYVNGGFYVGRYETGIKNGQRTQEGEITQLPVIQKAKYPYNYVTTVQAQMISNTFATTGNTSSLMFGIQWDLIMKYLETNGVTSQLLNENSKTWGRYSNTSFATTGYSNNYKKQNIYDLAGNTSERTLESSSTYVVRGGSYKVAGNNEPATYRGNDNGTSQKNVGFRVALYQDLGPDYDTEGLEGYPIPEQGVIVDVVDPLWRTRNGQADKENNTATVELVVTDKYFANSTLTADDIKIYDKNTGQELTNARKTLSAPMPLVEIVNISGTEYELQYGVKYILEMYNISVEDDGTDEDGEGYIIFTPTEPIIGEKAKYKSGSTQNLTNIKFTIEEGTATDKSGNTNKAAELNLGHGNVEGETDKFEIQPEVFDVRKIKDAANNKETFVFNITDRNYDPSDLITLDVDKDGDGNIDPELTIWIDGVQLTAIPKPETTEEQEANKDKIWMELTNIPIKLDIDGEKGKILGHQYTLVLWNITETAKQAGKDYLEWSGTLEVKVETTAARDLTGNTLNPATTTISDFVDFIKPEIEQLTVTDPIDETNKTYTMSFNVIDKYIDEIDELTLENNEIILYVDGEPVTVIAKPETEAEQQNNKNKVWIEILKVPITSTMNKTIVNEEGVNTITNGTYTIGYTYTLVLSNFEEVLRRTGKSYKELSGIVSIEIAESALKDTSNNTSDLLTLNGELVDFIKPEFTYKYAGTSRDTEPNENPEINYDDKILTVVFDVTDKYFNSSNLGTDANAQLIKVLVDGKLPGDTNGDGEIGDGETLAITKTLSKTAIYVMNKETKETTIQAADYEIQSTEQKVGEKYELVVRNLQQNPSDGFDFSGIVTLGFDSGIVDDTSSNKNDATIITIGIDENDGNPNTEANPDGQIVDMVDPTWEAQNIIIDKETGTAIIDIIGKDKYFKESALTPNDIAIKIDGQNVIELGYVNLNLSEATELFEDRDGDGTDETKYGVKYTLTLTGWEETQDESVYIDWNGIRSIVIAENMLTDTSNNTSKEAELIIEESEDQYTPSFTNRTETELNYTTDSRVELSYVLYKDKLETTPYEEGDYRVISTTEQLPEGTKLTLKDYVQGKVYYYHITGISSEYEVENERYLYRLSDFIELGSIDVNYKNSNTYYNKENGYALEKYSLSIDFIDSGIETDRLAQETYLELRDSSGKIKYENGDATIKYNLYSEGDAEVTETLKFAEGQSFEVKETLEIPITITASILEQEGILDTKYHDKIAGIGIQIVDKDNKRINPEDIGSFSLTNSETTYNADENGVIRMPIFKGLGNMSGDYKLTITQQSIPTETYTVQVLLYTADDGKYNGSEFITQQTFNVKFINVSLITIGVTAETKDRLINQSSEIKTVDMTINVDKPTTNTNIRVELYKRKPTYSDINDVNSYTGTQYDLVDINQYLQAADALEESVTGSKEYMVTSEVTNTAIQFTKQLIDNIATGEYKLVFKAYEENTLAHEASKTFIVVP